MDSNKNDRIEMTKTETDSKILKPNLCLPKGKRGGGGVRGGGIEIYTLV